MSYGHETLVGVSVGASASEMKAMLARLIHPDVRVTRHDHDDMGEGVAWAVTYPRRSPNMDLNIVDTFATGKNAQVNVHPILSIKTFSLENDSSGDFRIVIDGESTAPLSYRASQAKILLEMHRLSGIGKVNMLGPVTPGGDVLSSVQLNGLVDDSFTLDGHKSIALVGDFTSTFAPGDQPRLVHASWKLRVSRTRAMARHRAQAIYTTHFIRNPLKQPTPRCSGIRSCKSIQWACLLVLLLIVLRSTVSTKLYTLGLFSTMAMVWTTA